MKFYVKQVSIISAWGHLRHSLNKHSQKLLSSLPR